MVEPCYNELDGQKTELSLKSSRVMLTSWEICVETDYKGRVHVVFDGYLEKSTKDHVHLKRYPVQSMDVVVNLDHKVLCKTLVFLSNLMDKHRFIGELIDTLPAEGINVTKCSNDAGKRIVLKTVEQVETAKTHVILVVDNIDLLVLALHEIKIIGVQQKSIILRSSSDSFIDVQKIYQSHAREVIDNILPINALSGCITISSLYGIGKTKLMQSLDKYPDLTDHFEVFFAANIRMEKLHQRNR